MSTLLISTTAYVQHILPIAIADDSGIICTACTDRTVCTVHALCTLPTACCLLVRNTVGTVCTICAIWTAHYLQYPQHVHTVQFVQ